MYMKLSKLTIQLAVVIVTFTTFAGYSYLNAATTWTAPVGTPPANNVDAPINVGASNQIKNGSLGVNGLSINADYPTIAFLDPTPGSRLLYMQNHTNTFNLLGDRDADGLVVWANDQPQAFTVHLGQTTTEDYTYISNQARSAKYCNQDGSKCVRIEDLIKLLPLTCQVKFDYNFAGSGGGTFMRAITASDPRADTFAVGAYAIKKDYYPTTPLSDLITQRQWDHGTCDWKTDSVSASIGFVDPDTVLANGTGPYNSYAGDSSNRSGWHIATLPLTVGAKKNS